MKGFFAMLSGILLGFAVLGTFFDLDKTLVTLIACASCVAAVGASWSRSAGQGCARNRSR